MSPFYSDEKVVLYHGDCRDILPQLPSSSVDLIVTDPPYGIAYKSNRGHNHGVIAGDDGSLDVPQCLTLACRTLARGRHAYIFGEIDLNATPLAAQVELIWDKEIVGMGNLEQPWGMSHEPITFAVYEPSKANRDKGYGKLSARIRKGSVVRCSRTNGAATTRHPTEKPVGVLRQLIESSSVLGECVLDPFAGSGSTLEAAVLEGRRAIGIEVDARYCEVIANRMKQLRLRCASDGFRVPGRDVKPLPLYQPPCDSGSVAVEITVNGVGHVVPVGYVNYPGILRLVGGPHTFGSLITYRGPNASGHLLDDDSDIKLENGMVFNVTQTSAA